MRNFADKWNPVPDWNEKLIEIEGFSLERASGLSLTLVSGNTELALTQTKFGRAPIGWGVAYPDFPVALTLSRDRILIADEHPPKLTTGWNNSGFAVTRADDQFAVFAMEGRLVREVFARGTSLNFDTESPSCALSFAGIFAIAYQKSRDSIYILVESPNAVFLSDWVKNNLDQEGF